MTKTQFCRKIAVAGFIGANLASPAQAAENDAEQLHAELNAIRQDYEKRISLLESRIQELETKDPQPRPAKKNRPAAEPKTEIPKEAPPAPVPAENARQWRKEAGKQFRADTEIRDISKRPDAENPLNERIEDILEGYIDITGYFRAGYGRSDEGGAQTAFGIPGVAKYRLGNEAENYGELAFSKTFFGPDSFTQESANGPIAQMNLRLAFYNPYDNYGTGSDTDVTVPEMWASVANVIPGAPGAKIWAGSRFYRRHDIHINDFYFWDMSGGGGGIEDVPLGMGKFAVAWIGDGAESAVYSQLGTADPINQAGFSKGNVDLRWYDWPLFGGEGEVGLVYSSADSGKTSTGTQADSSQGAALSITRTKKDFLGDKESLHKSSLQIGSGPAKTFTSGFDTFSDVTGTYIRPDPEGSWRFRATDQFVFKPAEQFAFGTALVYQYTDFGDDTPDQQWISGGVRPIWFINEYFNIALETGVDYVTDSAYGPSGTLGKITLAPEIALGSEFFTRPVIRAFITYAQWSDGLQGSIGGLDYANESSGFTWGLQMESWW
ncbi:MAG: carbohydrate porin [Luteolibacter sp.]